jgi:hypothetical protein
MPPFISATVSGRDCFERKYAGYEISNYGFDFLGSDYFLP